MDRYREESKEEEPRDRWVRAADLRDLLDEVWLTHWRALCAPILLDFHASFRAATGCPPALRIHPSDAADFIAARAAQYADGPLRGDCDGPLAPALAAFCDAFEARFAERLDPRSARDVFCDHFRDKVGQPQLVAALATFALLP